MTGKSTDGAAAFEYHKAQLINGLNKIGDDIQQLQAAFQGFAQFVSSASFTPNGQTVFAVDASGKPGRKRKFKDEDGRKARKVKDPNAPRRPASSYILFQNSIRPSLREKFPDLTHTELMNRVSKIWSELPPEKKETYERQHAEAKVVYEEKRQQYEDLKNGVPPAPVDVIATDASSDAETDSIPPTKKDEDSEDVEDDEEDAEEEDEVDAEDDEEEVEAPSPPKKKSRAEYTPKEKKEKKRTSA